MSDILDKVRKLNWLLQESHSGALSFEEICEVLCDLLESNVYALDYDGKVLGVAFKVKEDSSLVSDEKTGDWIMPEEYNKEMLKITETKANLHDADALKIFKYDYDTSVKLHTFIPIVGGGTRLGTLIMARYEPEFTDEDLVLGEVSATIVGVEIQRNKMERERQEAREEAVVQMAIGTLSYSEAEAVQHIFSELEGDEGILVASRIADKSGITRSVIVNALRKLESASVIETRSLGMKGTRIKVLNSKLKSELVKMKTQ